MAEKRISKRLIAFVLGFCMVCTTCFHTARVRANDSETQFTELTLSELGIAGGSYDSGATGVREGGFANTIISFYATSVGQYTPRIHFGTWGEIDRSGINILFYGEALVVGNDGFDSVADRKIDYIRTEIAASDYGLTSFLNQKILYQLKTEYLALDADGVKNDIQFTLYVNETEAVKVDIKDQTDKLGNYMYFCDGVHILEDYKEAVQEKPDEVEKQELTNLKLSDIGIVDGSYDSGATATREAGFENTSIRFYATAKGANTPRIHFGTWGEIDRSGINILLFGDTLVVGNDGFDSEADRKLEYERTEIAASDFGLNSFLEEKILYQLDTEYVAMDTDEVVNDIRFTLYVNETEAVKIKIKDQTEKLGNYMYFCDGVFEIENEAEQEEPEQPEEETPVELCMTYKKMTLRDYLLEEVDMTSGMIQKTYDNQSLHGTSFGATFQFSADNNGTTAFYLGGNEWCGIRIEALTDGSLGVSHVGADGTQVWIASIAPDEVGMKTFLGEAFELIMTFDIYGEKEGRANCKMGFYINGKLYSGEHLTLKNVEKETLTRKIFIYGSGTGSLSIKSIYKEVDYSIWGLTEKWKQTLGIVK